MTTVCETLSVARSNIAESVKRRPSKARGRPPLDDQELVDEIKTIIGSSAICPPTDIAGSTRSFVGKPAAKTDYGQMPSTSTG
jgi:hypothetical protein